MSIKRVIIVAIVLSITACSSSSSTIKSNTTTTDDSEASLVNRDWVLVQFEGSDGTANSITNEFDFEFSIRFSLVEEPDGDIRRAVSGVNVCNTYSGEFSLEQSTLLLSNVAEDDRACERAAESPASLFARVLFTTESAPMFSVDNNLLEISSGSNERLIFTDNAVVDLTEVRSGDLASLGNNIFSKPRYQLFRDQQELNEFYGSLVQCPCTIEGPPQPNFDESTILFVAHEIVGSGGHSIEIVSSRIETNRLVIEIQKQAPGENCIVTDAPTGPYMFYSVVGVYENIDFVEKPTLNAPCG